ncbi:glycosyltransferase family 4 protein [Metabacillus halosaccharovorans]|uniref:glycosyltransferase family 4 protein n=1 Tax=Metabacillus halosaccharovorans TaxID=930124 RepID=UPI001C2000FE|nr:glycosyltransferase family 4 protein [Metabacillus halosaccharovorans]MBU7594457.1 glycosyltransferase family 4 protein [Metabacillus halosaccharovorans]
MKKKILIVNSFYDPDIVGGAEVSTQVLAESLNEDFNVTVLTSSNHRDETLYDYINGVQVIRIPNLNKYSLMEKNNPNLIDKLLWHFNNTFNKKQLNSINKIIKEVNPDIVHTQNLNGIGSYIWTLAKKNNCFVMHTLRDYQLIRPTTIKFINYMISSVNRKRAKNVNCVIGISKFILKEFSDVKLFESSDKKVIYNTINNKTYEKKSRLDSSPLKIGYFGRLEVEKGIEFFLKAVTNISSHVVEEVCIVGTGSCETELYEEYSRDKRIKFWGKLPFEETQLKMSQMDLIIVPSLWPEPFGRVLIEAYRQGTPVVATNVGGIPEIIQNKEMLVEADDIQGLEEKIRFIFNLDKNKFEKLSQDCKNYSLSFSKPHDEYISLYKYILENK